MLKYKNEIQKVAGVWTAWAFHQEAAMLLNRRLLQYAVPSETVLEGVFKFKDADLPYVKAVLERFGGTERTEAVD